MANRIENMSDEELQAILKADCESQESNDNQLDFLLLVMQELAERRKARGEEMDVIQAWENFKKYYICTFTPLPYLM